MSVNSTVFTPFDIQKTEFLHYETNYAPYNIRTYFNAAFCDR
jgi:hypothetical protein